jgi:hypothetical protein
MARKKDTKSQKDKKATTSSHDPQCEAIPTESPHSAPTSTMSASCLRAGLAAAQPPRSARVPKTNAGPWLGHPPWAPTGVR